MPSTPPPSRPPPPPGLWQRLRRRGDVLVSVAIGAVALVAVAATVAHLMAPDSETGRPRAPIEGAVVRAPIVVVFDTSMSGGPPAPGQQDAPMRR